MINDNDNKSPNGANDLLSAMASANDNQNTDSPVASNQATGGLMEMDIDTTGVSKKTLPASVLLLIGLLVVGVAALSLMRIFGNVSTQNDESMASAVKQIDMALAALVQQQETRLRQSGTGNDPEISDTDRVITMFIKDPTSKQVQPGEIQKNPFTLITARKDNDNHDQFVIDNRAKQEKMKRIRDELARMKLQTVMNGQTPMAVISGKVVRIGDQIGRFQIEQIKGVCVTLSTQGTKYQLSMEQRVLSNAQ